MAETWLTNTVANNEIDISGYSLARLDRAGRPGGGVCLYYMATLPVTVQPDLKVDGIEAVWISLHHSKQRHLFACMYRPPAESIHYWDRFEQALHQAAVVSPSVTLLGNFNINVSSAVTPQLHRFNDAIHSFGLRNLVSVPTRITPRCPVGTTLDLILTSSPATVSCNVVPCTLSDHSAVHARLDLALPSAKHQHSSQRRGTSLTRNMRTINLPEFRDELANANLSVFQSTSSTDEMWSTWHTKFMSCS